TGVTTYLGPVLQPDVDRATAMAANWTTDLGLPQFTTVTVDGVDYFHLYFPEFRMYNGNPAASGLSTARAPVREVLEAAAQGQVTPWWKYSPEGRWDSPAWGGSSADIQGNETMAWAPQVVRSTELGGYVMVTGVSPREMMLSTSANGLHNWSARVPLLRDPGNVNAYPNLVGSTDPADLGRVFHLFYLQWPSPQPNWDNARVMRRTITCTAGLPATTVPFVRYSNGRKHLVTTGPALPGYHVEGRDWSLLTAQQPGTRPLYGCRNGADDHYISDDAGCGATDFTILQTEGWIYTSPPALPHAALYRCHIPGLGDHFVSIDP
ncbi:hypothetical protein, partial [Virgisporangium aurantiacum]|uniref:hypothetical protein n=1 Tax=Virgisporangium aurantiacum TaxID=175570 RepID=UPI001950A255